MTANVNGIRAAGRKGFFDWLPVIDADVICLQETKAQMAHLPDELYRPAPYACFFSDAEKKGYSGVGIYSKEEPLAVRELPIELAQQEGRYLEVELEKVTVVSLYLPSGSSGEIRQAMKYRFMKEYQPILAAQLQREKPMIICGDFNIVHQEIDIKNWKANQKNSGCLPEERAWLDQLFSDGWVDAFRQVNQSKDQYTWWSNRGRARENNVGWRIDYQMTSSALRDCVKDALVYKEQWFSDHAPLVINYDI